jgi:hypothetical protein
MGDCAIIRLRCPEYCAYPVMSVLEELLLIRAKDPPE